MSLCHLTGHKVQVQGALWLVGAVGGTVFLRGAGFMVSARPPSLTMAPAASIDGL